MFKNKKGQRGIDSKIFFLVGALIIVVLATALAPVMFDNIDLFNTTADGGNVPTWVPTVLVVIVGAGIVFLIWRSFGTAGRMALHDHRKKKKETMNRKGQGINSKITLLVGALIIVVLATALSPVMFDNINLFNVTTTNATDTVEGNVPTWVPTVLIVIVGAGIVFLIWRSFGTMGRYHKIKQYNEKTN